MTTDSRSSYYFNKTTWEINTDPRNGMKINIPLTFALAPVLGALFLMFLPVIGFVLLGQSLARAAVAKFSDLTFGTMVPGEAHLTGKPADTAKAPEQDEKMDKLEQEIKSRRE